MSGNSDRSAKRRRGPGRPFPKGKSGNAKGRPPLPADYKQAMEDRLGPAGLAALDAVLANPAHPRHEQAAEYVVNRWKGTPTARTEISAPGGGPLTINTVSTSGTKRARVEALLAVAAARVASASARAKQEPDGSDDAG